MAVVGEDRMPSNNYTDIKPKESIKSPPANNEKKGKIKGIKKQTFGERIAENFLNLDREQIRDHLLFDWLFPEIISTFDSILRMIFFGDRNGGPKSARQNGRFGSRYSSAFDESRRERERTDLTRQNFKHIRLEFYNEKDAIKVLDDLRESLEESSGGYVTVKELYSHKYLELPTNYTMGNWGWYDLEDCVISYDGESYVLEMPKAVVVVKR